MKLNEELKQQSEINAVQMQQLTEQSHQVQQQCTVNLRKYRQLKKCINLYWFLILSFFLVASVVDAYWYLTLNSEPATSLPNCSQSLQEEQLSHYVKKIDVIGLGEQITQLNHAAARMKTDIRCLGEKILQLSDDTAQIKAKLNAKVEELTLAVSKSMQDIEWVKIV